MNKQLMHTSTHGTEDDACIPLDVLLQELTRRARQMGIDERHGLADQWEPAKRAGWKLTTLGLSIGVPK